MHYVIIGNSAAAVGCIEGIRQIDRTGPVTVLSRENHHTYSRPLISYLLAGKTDAARMRYRPADFYRATGCTLRAGRAVTRIRAAEKQVLLADGSSVAYDKLLVATGSRALVPPIPGLETVAQQFTFMSLDDATALRRALTRNSRVLILGAGLIGLKCAEGIARLAGQVTLVDLAPRILPNVLDGAAAAMVQAHLERQQLTFILDESVQAFDGDTALLAGGRNLPFDVLVVAVGVRPETALLEAAGGQVEAGIVTDACCRTTLPDIYAAGDCVESYDLTTGRRRVLALWPNAYMQGECAGVNMAGGEKRYERAIPMNATRLWGLPVLTAGSYEGTAYVAKDRQRPAYKKLVTGDGRLKGYILVGEVARAGIYTALIREQKPLREIDFDLIKEQPQLMAFSRRDREKMLGGGLQ